MGKSSLTKTENEETCKLPSSDISGHIHNKIIGFSKAACPFPPAGINEGDQICVRFTQEIVDGSLMVYRPPDSDQCAVGFLYDNFGDISIIDTKGQQGRFKKREIKIVGVIVGVLKPFDASICSPYDTVKPSEATAICDSCGKTESGDKKFLGAMGWRLKDSNSLCVACR